ncbi:MAG: hypothetical protein ACLRFL_02420 [Clostridia bacterium]
MNVKKKTLLIKNREVNIEEIDLIKAVTGGIVIKYANGSLTFFRQDTRLSAIYRELISNGHRNFLPLQQILINTDNLIGISDGDSDDLIFTLIFEKNDEKIELNSKEELVSLGLKIREKQSINQI